MSQGLADQIVLWILCFAAIPVNVYPIFYWFRPWRVSGPTRALMVKAFGNLIVIDLALAFVWFGDYPGRDVARVFGFSVFTLGIWYLLISMLTSPGAKEYPPWTWLPRYRKPR